MFENVNEKIATKMFSKAMEPYQKEIEQLKILYKEFLMNYKGLLDVFRFKTPLEIYGAFMYSYNNGFLSKNRKINNPNQNFFASELIGLDVIDGEAVCRNLSAFLTKLYQLYHYESCVLAGLIDLPKNIFSFANHAITYVKDESNSYFLDSLNYKIFTQDKKDFRLLLSQERRFKINSLIAIYFNVLEKNDDYKKCFQFLKKNNRNFNYSIYGIEWTQLICSKNLDILNQFYFTNLMLMCEISSKKEALQRKMIANKTVK